jgi:hypothetical protein
VLDPQGGIGQLGVQGHATPLGGRLDLLDRRFDAASEVLRPEVEEDEARIELR